MSTLVASSPKTLSANFYFSREPKVVAVDSHKNVVSMSWDVGVLRHVTIFTLNIESFIYFER